MGHKGHWGDYTGNAKWSRDHAHTKVTSKNYDDAVKDDAAHIDYLKRDIDYDNKHGHSDEKMTADEKHISKLAGDMKYDKKHHGSPAKEVKPISQHFDGNLEMQAVHSTQTHHSQQKQFPGHNRQKRAEIIKAERDARKELEEKSKKKGVNMNSPARQEQGDFEYEDPNYRETKEYKKFQRKQKRKERKLKRNAAPQKHCMGDK